MEILIKDIYPFFKDVMSSLHLDEQILSELLAPATTEGHADLAIPCHSLSKIMKKSPVDISEEIVSLVSDDILSIAKVSSKNGFVNISATNNYIEFQLSHIFKDERLGVLHDQSRTFVVDYSAPNVAKEMHVGHLGIQSILPRQLYLKTLLSQLMMVAYR